MALAAKTVRHLRMALANSGLSSSLVTKIDANGAGTDVEGRERRVLRARLGSTTLGNEVADKIDTPSALSNAAKSALQRMLGSSVEGQALDAQIHPS